MSDDGRRGDVTHPADQDKAPLGFKVVVIAAVLYLGLRLVQGIVWFVDWLR